MYKLSLGSCNYEPKAKQMRQYDGKEVATLAGGCFWCLATIFNEVDGIEKVISGYTGGKTINPSYSSADRASVFGIEIKE